MNPRIVDLTGQRFGRWIALGLVDGRTRVVGNKHVSVWSVACECGVVGEVRGTSLRDGSSQSCGCLRHDLLSARKRTHGHTVGRLRTTEYAIWSGMIQRCHYPYSPAYADYGGRGIVVCARWRESFAAFLADVGPRPRGRSLDRFPDQNGNYEPSNVRWATPIEQGNNRRDNRLIEWNGETLSVRAWARRLGVPSVRIYSRLRNGWSGADALSRAPRQYTKGDSR